MAKKDSCRPRDQNSIELAMATLKKEGLSVRRAAAAYGVPKSTLHDHYTGKVHQSHKGPPRYLNDMEEKQLVAFLIGCAQIGYARSRKEVIGIVEQILSQRSGNTASRVTSGWWESFRRRHPELTIRMSEKLAYVRSVMTNHTIINSYFDLLESTVKDNNLLNRPGSIFNCDESGICLDVRPGKVIALKGMRNVTAISSGNKMQITVLACVSASGHAIPPMVVFPGKNFIHQLTINEVPGTLYAMSPNGWMDSEIFNRWFEQHFLRYVPATRPIILLLDGHSSHYHPDTVRLAAKHDVILFCLPPHTTHVSQPLDVSCFAPLKKSWSQQCDQFSKKNPSRVITKYEFSSLFSKAWYSAFTPSNIIAGFRATGIYPLNRDAIKLPPTVDDISTKLNAISFLPLFSPSRDHVSDKSDHSSGPARCETLSGSQPSLSFEAVSEFTDEEVRLFEKRFENGYDLPDPKYQQWLEKFHGRQVEEDSTLDADANDTYITPSELQKESGISAFLTLPVSLQKKEVRERNFIRGARVLTSEESLKMLEEQEEKKKNLEREKAERIAQRQEKARIKAERIAERQEKARKKVERTGEQQKVRKKAEEPVRGSKPRKETCSNPTKPSKVKATKKSMPVTSRKKKIDNITDCSGVACFVCGDTEDNDEDGERWIQCDECDTWSHLGCLPDAVNFRLRKFVGPCCK